MNLTHLVLFGFFPGSGEAAAGTIDAVVFAPQRVTITAPDRVTINAPQRVTIEAPKP